MTTVRKASAVLVTGIIAALVLGAALGVLWWKLAPRVAVLVKSGQAWPADYQPSEYLTSDLTYAALAVLAGIALTIGLVRMRRDHLISALASSILAGIIGSVAMWFVGTRLGYVDIAGLTATEDQVVQAPLVLHMPALLLIWPIAAALVITVMAAGDWTVSLRARRRADAAAALSD